MYFFSCLLQIWETPKLFLPVLLRKQKARPRVTISQELRLQRKPLWRVLWSPENIRPFFHRSGLASRRSDTGSWIASVLQDLPVFFFPSVMSGNLTLGNNSSSHQTRNISLFGSPRLTIFRPSEVNFKYKGPLFYTRCGIFWNRSHCNERAFALQLRNGDFHPYNSGCIFQENWGILLDGAAIMKVRNIVEACLIHPT